MANKSWGVPLNLGPPGWRGITGYLFEAYAALARASSGFPTVRDGHPPERTSPSVDFVQWSSPMFGTIVNVRCHAEAWSSRAVTLILASLCQCLLQKADAMFLSPDWTYPATSHCCLLR